LAHITGVRLNIGMGIHVVTEISGITKSFLTNAANVRRTTRVRKHMFL